MPQRFREFDITSLSHAGSVGFIAPTQSGKTTLMLWWLWIIFRYGYTDYLNYKPPKKVKADLVVIMCPTLEMQEGNDSDFARCVSRGFMFAGFSESFINRLLAYQLKRRKEGSIHRVILILDDMSHEETVFKSQMFLKLHTLGRHYNMQLWTVYHDARQIPTKVRTNYGAIVAFKDNSEINLMVMAKNYFGGFGGPAKFRDAFNVNTVNRQAMIQLKHGVTSGKLTDYTFITKAYPKKMPPKWKMGRKVYWTWSRKYPFGCENSVMPVVKQKQKKKPKPVNDGGFIPVEYNQPIADTNELDEHNSELEKELNELEAVEQSLLQQPEPSHLHKKVAMKRKKVRPPSKPTRLPPRPPPAHQPEYEYQAPPQPLGPQPFHRSSRPPHAAPQSASAIVREALNQSSHFSQHSHASRHHSKRLRKSTHQRPVPLTMFGH